MTAEIVAVGTEVLLGDITDTNSAELGRKLAEFGVFHFHRQTVGDNVERLTEALQLALSRSDIVFTIGGLGPTTDDLTRDGIAAALQDELVFDSSVEEDIRAKLARRNIEFLENQKRQCYRPSCAKPIENPNGTAPGMHCSKGGKTLIALPGPRREFVPMLEGPVSAFLKSLVLGVIHARVVRMIGIPESQVQEKLDDLMSAENPSVAPYVKGGEVHVKVRAGAKSIQDAEELISPVVDEIASRLGKFAYATEDLSLEEAILSLLREKSQTLAVAESCTGGGLGERITAIPGSSDVFLGGVISYHNDVKHGLLGVSEETLANHGAVSEECAREMAEGVQRAIGATWAVSITGIAGPDGGSAEKPVGLVYIGVAGPGRTIVVRNEFIGDRANVRERSSGKALELLHRRITSAEE